MLWKALAITIAILSSSCTVGRESITPQNPGWYCCQDFRDGTSFRFHTDNVISVTYDSFSITDTCMNVIDEHGIEHQLCNSHESWMKCDLEKPNAVAGLANSKGERMETIADAAELIPECTASPDGIHSVDRDSASQSCSMMKLPDAEGLEVFAIEVTCRYCGKDGGIVAKMDGEVEW